MVDWYSLLLDPLHPAPLSFPTPAVRLDPLLQSAGRGTCLPAEAHKYDFVHSVQCQHFVMYINFTTFILSTT